MILRRIYSTPNVFSPVTFKLGINFIFGQKEVAEGEEKKSLNGIGKSTFLDLIDFALLSSFTKQSNKRLFAAYNKGYLKGVSITLEFEVDKKAYQITRRFDKPNSAFLGKIKEKEVFTDIEEVKELLCDIIFKRDDYIGYYSNHWLRKLIPFYIKVKKSKRDRFADPIQYIRELTEVELNQYHFFLLNIDNKLSTSNFQVQSDLKRLTPTITEISRFITESYQVEDFSEAQKKINSLHYEISKLENAIHLFRLSYKYKIDEDKANKLTEEIKQYWFENNSDERKIDSYRDSLRLDISVKTGHIKRIYEDLNQLLAENIKKTLDQAIDFRKNLIESRKEFIEEEIKHLEESIKKRNEEINLREEERSKIFSFLAAKKAIRDLTEAYAELDRKKNDAATLQAKIQIYLDLSKEKKDIQYKEKEIEKSVYQFKIQIQKQEQELNNVITTIYNALYPEIQSSSVFAIDLKPETKSKIQFNVITNNEMLSEGKGRGRVLVYDLSVLFYAIEKNFKTPRFLIHDGVFDGMDKTHFIKLYKLLQDELLRGKQFQYIVTLNEEGTLSDKFGESELVSPSNISEEAILVLTPTKKLLGDF
ncbi:MAG: DUF2326 domain-containing protein [Bacteroidota bacterium]